MSDQTNLNPIKHKTGMAKLEASQNSERQWSPREIASVHNKGKHDSKSTDV